MESDANRPTGGPMGRWRKICRPISSFLLKFQRKQDITATSFTVMVVLIPLTFKE
ncbi:hypothetical protein G3P84_004211 [Escherichia coli]|nr:hypothetical protein [Escherichia coli]EFI3535266.1 hypothetical protein [Escherichia coli]EFI3607923.1 hypothetical protein [Escherichia coli]EFI3652889.1 hypothetical protein [Escherichia coli]EFI4252818.1 hypothetical protein [Escherichia coli]